MRQTSRAVALLLAVESAQAVITPNIPAMVAGSQYYKSVWMPEQSVVESPLATQQLNSRTAGFSLVDQQQFLKTAVAASPNTSAWVLDTNAYQTAITSTALALSTTTSGSHCMTCIGAGSVWCSRTYSYLESGAQYQLENNTASVGLYNLTLNVKSTEASLIAGDAQDAGACCGSFAEFTAIVGNQSAFAAIVNTAPAAGATQYPRVSGSCPAFDGTYVPDATADTAVWGEQNIENSAILNYSSWWCSNGLYKKLTVFTDNSPSANTGTIEINAQQLLGYNMNKRSEIAMVGCPQKATQCGNTNSTIVTAMDASTSTSVPTTITVATGNTNGPTLADKCTWVATGYVVAPTFFFSEGVGVLGLVTSNWQIHAMEYTATAAGANFSAAVGSLQSSEVSNQDGLVTSGSALQKGNFIPRFAMPAEQFATLRTWYGEATALNLIDPNSKLPASWLSPGQSPVTNTKTISGYLATAQSQQYGNVVNVPDSTIATTTTSSTTTIGNTNFGIVNAIKFDLRVARFFPAKVAQTVWASGDAQQKLYVSSKSTYDAAKTMWDNYVALLEKNAKTDAFAALFSPPKAPTVPPMPNMPWKPNAYAGYVRATAKEVYNYGQSTTLGFYSTTNAPTAQQFWANLSAAQTVGGWGSFTAQVLRYRDQWGKSFGTIGYSGDSNKNALSAVWNYTWTCGATALSAPSTTSPCDASYTYATTVSETWTTTTTPSVANTTTLVSVVTLWSSSNRLTGAQTAVSEYAWVNNSFAINWLPGSFSTSLVSLTAIAAPVAATAAKGLSGVAGAQALAATSAAALAVAAALY